MSKFTELATWKKIVIVFVGLGLLGNIIGAGPKPDPCTCTEVMATKSMIGFRNLSYDSQGEYNSCVRAYDTKSKAYDKCIDKVMDERYSAVEDYYSTDPMIAISATAGNTLDYSVVKL